jgi:hypothetical protein
MEDEGEQNKKEKSQGKVAKQKSEGRNSPPVTASQRICFTSDKLEDRRSNEKKMRERRLKVRGKTAIRSEERGHSEFRPL